MSDDLIKRSDAIDTIYREDAIKAINLRARIPHDVASAHYASMAINAIRSVPSADRPQGEWIRISSLYSLDRTYRCSVCGKVIDDMPMDEYYDPAYKGCPYCFTRMKGADDE